MESPPDQTDAPPERVTVYASVRGLFNAAVAPLLLLGIGGYAVAVAGLHVLPITLLALGAALGVYAGLDFPRRSVVTPDGIVRHCLLRRHVIPWDEVREIERDPDPTMRRVRAELQRDPGAGMGRGGLVARAGRRKRFILSDQLETQVQFDRIRRLAGQADAGVMVTAPRPR